MVAAALMRFDINREMNTMFVDDMWVAELDVSSLPSDVTRVKWNGTDGWIKHVNATLESRITDPSPYQPQLNAWTTARLSVTPPPTLAEAKSIKITLIEQLFDLKRQAPFHYVVAAGDFMWEATDGAAAGMAIATLPGLLATLTGTSDGTVVGKINTLADQINANIVAPGNAFENQVNQWIVNPGNANWSEGVSAFNSINSIFGQVNSNIAGPAGTFVSHYDGTVLGLVGDGHNTINNKLQSSGPAGSPSNVAAPGLDGQIPPSLVSISAIGPNPYNFTYTFTAVYYPTFVNVSHASVTPDPSIPPIQWIPIGSATPVNLSATEMAGIMSGITSRRLSLQTTRVNKIAAVNALTTVQDVIAYDATTGWPT
jgi:hypothetical protein